MKKLVLLAFVSMFGASVFAAGLNDKYPGSKDVYEVTDLSQKKSITKILEEVDVAFEMGDGYYDVLSEKLYVIDDGVKTKGYIKEYKLSYSEEPETVTVIVRFKANGKRYGDIEETDRVIEN